MPISHFETVAATTQGFTFFTGCPEKDDSFRHSSFRSHRLRRKMGPRLIVRLLALCYALLAVAATPVDYGTCTCRIENKTTNDGHNGASLLSSSDQSSLTQSSDVHSVRRRSVPVRSSEDANAGHSSAGIGGLGSLFALSSHGGAGGGGEAPFMHATSEITDMLRLTALLPAEALQLVRMLTVPLINTTLGVPANMLEHLSNASMPDLNSQAIFRGLSNASHWLHGNNSSSSGNGSSFSFARMSPPLLFSGLLQLNHSSVSSPHDRHGHGHGSANASSSSASSSSGSSSSLASAGAAAQSAVQLGERVLFAPLNSILALTQAGGLMAGGSNHHADQLHLGSIVRMLSPQAARGASDGAASKSSATTTITSSTETDSTDTAVDPTEEETTTGVPVHDADSATENTGKNRTRTSQTTRVAGGDNSDTSNVKTTPIGSEQSTTPEPPASS